MSFVSSVAIAAAKLQEEQDVRRERDAALARVKALEAKAEDWGKDARESRHELSLVAEALGVAEYGGCYSIDEVLSVAKVAKADRTRLAHLEKLLGDWGDTEHPFTGIAIRKLYYEATEIATKRKG